MNKTLLCAALAACLAGSAGAQDPMASPNMPMTDPGQDVQDTARAVAEQQRETARTARRRAERTRPELPNDAALIAMLQDLQARLRAGENVVFELLAGAPASYEMTKVAPRDAFLQIDFGQARSIERVRTDNRLWQPYRLKVLPEGPGRLVWDVEVIVGANGAIERVSMVYKPPAPS